MGLRGHGGRGRGGGRFGETQGREIRRESWPGGAERRAGGRLDKNGRLGGREEDVIKQRL